MNFVAIYASWNTARKQAGLPDVVMHSLRHSFASDMISVGQSLFLVGSALGHRQIKSTARYSHLSQHTLLAAVDASANATGIDWGPAQAVKTGDNLALVAA